jgi:L-amino acid N-acyltransferase YncA
MAAVTIRAARHDDAAAVAAIYNAGAVRFDYGLPFLVAENGDDRMVGFARVTPYSDRPFYAGVGDHGVYVDPAARGHGLGRRLLEELAAESERRGLYKLTSRIFTTNAASRAVHRAAGFVEVGVKRRHGRLDGEWKDCVLVERLLGEAADDPT